MIEVKMLPPDRDPLVSLYTAYRVAYSALTPMQVIERIESERITGEQMLDFCETRLETGHASPLQQVSFEFGIAGVSRAFSHQFVRHHVGLDIEQQSQRYVVFKDGSFPYTVPPTIADDVALNLFFNKEMEQLGQLYNLMIEAGIPAEDARFLLPNAANTNLKIKVNFLELQHIADLRLCLRAQWEFRRVVAKMRAEVNRAYPWLGKRLGPKCMAYRMGYCDETKEDWAACPLSRVRPHRSDVIP